LNEIEKTKQFMCRKHFSLTGYTKKQHPTTSMHFQRLKRIVSLSKAGCDCHHHGNYLGYKYVVVHLKLFCVKVARGGLNLL
jgi:hypothetical protein